MKILMFGWEFPPHISGGLGTACQGLTRGLSESGEVQVTFVVPRAWGDEEPAGIRVLGANQIPVSAEGIAADKLSAVGIAADQLSAEGLASEEISADMPSSEEISAEGIAADELSAKVVSESTPPDFLSGLIGVNLPLIPYQTPGGFWKLKNRRFPRGTRFVEITESGTIPFSGQYGPSLFREIRNYAIIARQIAEKESFDLIHAHDWMAFPSGMEASRQSGKPLVVHVHSTEFDRSGGEINHNIYNIEREGMEKAAKIIAVSNFTRQRIIDKYGIPPEKVITVHNAADPLTREEKKALRKGIPDLIVTFMGRITSQKGPEYFIEAARLVLSRMDNVRFVMAGNGDMLEDMISHAARLGITHKFHFTGFLRSDDAYHLLHMSDLFVMPSVSEPFGIVPLEALLANVPAIISRQSGVAEVLKHTLKINFWDTYALADAIYGVLNYPPLARLFTERGKEEAGNLKWEKTAQKVTQIYHNMMKENFNPTKKTDETA